MSALDINAYISEGFAPSGKMLGSNAMAGWIGSNGVPGRRSGATFGGATSGKCLPDQGGLQLVNNGAIIVSQLSLLYLAFQLNTTQSLSRLVNAVGQ